MATFVTVYNYLGYRLIAAPFGLPQAVVALLFVMYLAGTRDCSTLLRLLSETRSRC